LVETLRSEKDLTEAGVRGRRGDLPLRFTVLTRLPSACPVPIKEPKGRGESLESLAQITSDSIKSIALHEHHSIKSNTPARTSLHQ
jgi:hypothetical protein